MNIDINVITKELEYISTSIKTCKDILWMYELFYTFTILDVIYYHYTKKHYESPKSKYIDLDLADQKYYQECHENDLDFVRRFENEKAFLAPIFNDYVNKFNDCPETIYFDIKEPKYYSLEEVKKIILDFYSQFDISIYNIVEYTFENNQIQTGINNINYMSSSKNKLNFFISEYFKLDSNMFTKSTYDHFLRLLVLASERINEEDISDEECDKLTELLNKSYDKLTLRNRKGEKREIAYDEIGETNAFTYTFIPLNKTYILIQNDKFDMETIITLVHELGHVVEAYKKIFYKGIKSNSEVGYFSEVSSTFFEYEFIKYLLNKGIDDESEEKLYSYYLDIADDFYDLSSLLDAKPNYENCFEMCEYTSENETFNIDLLTRIKYGYDKYISLLLSKRYHGNPDGFNEIHEKFIEVNDSVGTKKLLEELGISEEEFYNLNCFDNEILTLIKKYDNK